MPVDTQSVKPKTFKVQRRQFAEAILGRAVLVVEGGSEAAVFPAVSSALEAALGRDRYDHLDLAGVTIFDAGGDAMVPTYGPIFKALGKRAFAFYDKRSSQFSSEDQMRLTDYDDVWQSPYDSIEELLVQEVPEGALRRFLDEAKDRRDYPKTKKYSPSMSDGEVRALAKDVLLARKGEAHAYGELLIGHCNRVPELPKTLREVLEKIHQLLNRARPVRGSAGPARHRPGLAPVPMMKKGDPWSSAKSAAPSLISVGTCSCPVGRARARRPSPSSRRSSVARPSNEGRKSSSSASHGPP